MADRKNKSEKDKFIALLRKGVKFKYKMYSNRNEIYD